MIWLEYNNSSFFIWIIDNVIKSLGVTLGVIKTRIIYDNIDHYKILLLKYKLIKTNTW